MSALFTQCPGDTVQTGTVPVISIKYNKFEKDKLNLKSNCRYKILPRFFLTFIHLLKMFYKIVFVIRWWQLLVNAIYVFSESQFSYSCLCITEFTANFEKERKEFFREFLAGSRMYMFCKLRFTLAFSIFSMESADKHNHFIKLVYFRQMFAKIRNRNFILFNILNKKSKFRYSFGEFDVNQTKLNGIHISLQPNVVDLGYFKL